MTTIGTTTGTTIGTTTGTTIRTLVIDSRDFEVDPEDPFSLKVDLGLLEGAFHMVAAAELKLLVFPVVSNELGVSVLIPQLQGVQQTTTDEGNRGAFATVYYDCTEGGPGCLRVMKGSDLFSSLARFNPPIGILSRLAVSIRGHGGAVLTGADSGNEQRFVLALEFTLKSAGPDPGTS